MQLLSKIFGLVTSRRWARGRNKNPHANSPLKSGFVVPHFFRFGSVSNWDLWKLNYTFCIMAWDVSKLGAWQQTCRLLHFLKKGNASLDVLRAPRRNWWKSKFGTNLSESSQLKQKSLNVSRSVLFPCFPLSANLGRTSDIFISCPGCMKRYHLVSERWKSPAVFRCMPVKYNWRGDLFPRSKILRWRQIVFKYYPQVKKSWGMCFICFLQNKTTPFLKW